MAAKGSGGRTSSPSFPTGRGISVNVPGLPQPRMATTQDFVNMVTPDGTTPAATPTQNQTIGDAIKGKK